MTDRHDDRDDAFARRVRDAYAPPPMSGAARARFDAALEDRIARERWRFAPWLAAVLAAGAAALLVVSRLGPLAQAPVPVADTSAPEEEYVLALAGDTGGLEASLPAEYRAIAGMIEGD